MPNLSRTSGGRIEILQSLRAIARASAVQELPDAGAARLKILRELRHICVIISVGVWRQRLMRLLICLLAILAVAATGQIGFEINSGARLAQAAAQEQEPNTAPKIINARLNGKKLIITGENFGQGAVILVNGEAQKTKNDSENPASMLVAKKAGKKIKNGQAVIISVQNPAGAPSGEFGFFKGRIVSLEDGEKTVEFTVGDKFLLVLNKEPYKWEASVQNTAIVRSVNDVLPVLGAIGIFEAVGKGQTSLTALGSLACHNSNPPCLAPALQFQVNIVVK
jgi:hypothetical protein